MEKAQVTSTCGGLITNVLLLLRSRSLLARQQEARDEGIARAGVARRPGDGGQRGAPGPTAAAKATAERAVSVLSQMPLASMTSILDSSTSGISAKEEKYTRFMQEVAASSAGSSRAAPAEETMTPAVPDDTDDPMRVPMPDPSAGSSTGGPAGSATSSSAASAKSLQTILRMQRFRGPLASGTSLTHGPR